MNRLELFKEMYNMATHNLLCYSQDYLMIKPKPKFAQEWKKEKEKVELLEKIIEEEKQKKENVKSDKVFNKIETEEYE